MKRNKVFYGLHRVSLFLIIASVCLVLSSCATNRNVAEYNRFYEKVNKNSEVFKNKSLVEVAPEFWKHSKEITTHVIYGDNMFLVALASGNIASATIGEFMPIVGGFLQFGSGAKLQRKMSGFKNLQNWEICDCFIETFKKCSDLSTEANLSFVKKKNGVICETDVISSMKISDEDIVVFISTLDLFMFGEHPVFQVPRIPLRGEVGVTIATGKAWHEFIQKHNGYLPITHNLTLFRDYKIEWYSEIRKISPEMYMGNVTKQTESYVKSKWAEGDGAFLEQQLKTMVEDLAKETAKMLRIKPQ